MHTTALTLLLLTSCVTAPAKDTGDPSSGDGADGGDGQADGSDPGETDADGDGATAEVDCDDDDDQAYPGAPERCDGVDNDCDGALASGEDDLDGDGSPDCLSCDSDGFWADTRDESDAAALTATLTALTDGVSCIYSRSREAMFLSIDLDGTEVECVYTGRRVAITGSPPDEEDMNVEHSWPQSEGADEEPAKCDLHHLFPTDHDANAERGNRPFGVVSGTVYWSEGGSQMGLDASGDEVFEPRDEQKGDTARAMLYFALRYGHTLSADMTALFLTWHEADPPDAAEHDRNGDIQRFQDNANPFVACPDLPARVFAR